MDNSFAVRNRSKIFTWLCVFVMAVFVGRLFWLQVVRHDYYVGLADQEQLKRLIIPAKRGEIFALNGDKTVPLVLNQTVYTVFVDPSEVTDPTAVENTVKTVAGGNAVDDLSTRIHAKNRYQKLATGLSFSQAKMIKSKNLQGLGLQTTSSRVYPEGSLASQTLGFVDADENGVYGIEQGLNNQLHGTDGLLQSVTDVSNVPLTIGKENIHKPAVNGKNIVLSIDRNIQAYSERALARGAKDIDADNASVVVMDPQTGKVLAMANVPTYNPEKYGNVRNAADFNNGVISAPYEPGSVMKTFTLATAMDKGVIEPSSHLYNSGSVKVGDFTIHNAENTNLGTITYQTVLDNSLNTGSVEALKQLGGSKTINHEGRTTLYNYFYNRFRLGQPTGIEVVGENSGGIVSPDAQEGNNIRYANMTFGQGLDVTMLQVTAGFSSLVNGGIYHKPTVVAGTLNDKEALEPATVSQGERVVSESTAAKIRDMVHKTRLTSQYIEGDKGYYVGGKTGTSQAIINGRYVFSQTIGTYIGYGGTKDQTKYVIMVQVSGKNKKFSGGLHAKPIFTDISNWMLAYLKVQPKG